jgi:hypothetical protein
MLVAVSTWGAPSDERTGRSFVRVTVSTKKSVDSLCNLFTFYMLLKYVWVYNIYKASISPGSAEQIILERSYAWPLPSLGLLYIVYIDNWLGSPYIPACSVNCGHVCRENVFTEPLSSNGRLLWFSYSGFHQACHNIYPNKGHLHVWKCFPTLWRNSCLFTLK